MSIKKVLGTAIFATVIGFAGCSNTETPTTPLISEDYIACHVRDSEDDTCFDDIEIYMLKENGVSPEEANPLLDRLDAFDIMLAKRGKCGLTTYVKLIGQLGARGSELKECYFPIKRICLGETKTVDEVKQYIQQLKEWGIPNAESGIDACGVIMLAQKDIDPKKVKWYVDLETKAKDIHISAKDIWEFEEDIQAGKTTYAEIEKFAKQEKERKRLKTLIDMLEDEYTFRR